MHVSTNLDVDLVAVEQPIRSTAARAAGTQLPEQDTGEQTLVVSWTLGVDVGEPLEASQRALTTLVGRLDPRDISAWWSSTTTPTWSFPLRPAVPGRRQGQGGDRQYLRRLY